MHFSIWPNVDNPQMMMAFTSGGTKFALFRPGTGIPPLGSEEGAPGLGGKGALKVLVMPLVNTTPYKDILERCALQSLW